MRDHQAETAEALANLIDRHKPITNGAGWPVGCQCLDRIGFPAGRTWADHLALVIEVEHIAGRVMGAKAEQRAEDYTRRHGDPRASGGQVQAMNYPPGQPGGDS